MGELRTEHCLSASDLTELVVKISLVKPQHVLRRRSRIAEVLATFCADDEPIFLAQHGPAGELGRVRGPAHRASRKGFWPQRLPHFIRIKTR